ncbi:MAG: ArgR family transcriptional regulator, partial [Gemmatimonadetes bacterium]|nr:ArgR family transcriptional regulator [Gemmatimonadota bacterium]
MSKRARHAQILEAIREHRVSSQEALRELLHARGTEVTQATLSRDIRELRLVKIPDAEGTAHYSQPDEWESTPPLESLLPTLFHSAE